MGWAEVGAAVGGHGMGGAREQCFQNFVSCLTAGLRVRSLRICMPAVRKEVWCK